jgi:hypothetical protein
MRDIELIIKIPTETYEYWKKHKYEYVLAEAIAKGIPLPKGHGKLFDEKELKKEAIRREWSRIMYDTLDHTLSYMKPIIEADKEKQ